MNDIAAQLGVALKAHPNSDAKLSKRIKSAENRNGEKRTKA
jgi:hypothetical protein